MTKRKICVIDNMASHYRKAIYQLLDNEYDIHWFFGEPLDNIKELDLSLLKNARHLKHIDSIIPGAYRLKGMSKLIKSYDKVIMVGEPALLSSWGLLLRYRLFERKKNVYFWTHGWYGKEGFLKKIVKKIYFKLASGVITYGDYARNLMIKEGFSPEKIWAVHNSLDYDTQLQLRENVKLSSLYHEHFNNDFPNLVFIGRLAKYKKLHLLIEAVKKLKDKGMYYNLTVIGDGECEEELRNQVHVLGLDKDVWFYGACYDEKANAELISNADLCVSPGNVGLNAVHTLMFGTPVATHNSFPYQGPEFECIKEGETGTFFKQNDSDDIARCVSEWFANHKKDRDEIRKSCFEEIDNYWNPYFQINVLRNVLKN